MTRSIFPFSLLVISSGDYYRFATCKIICVRAAPRCRISHFVRSVVAPHKRDLNKQRLVIK